METTCPHCGKRYKVPDLAAGKQVRCGNPGCKQTFTVAPAAAPVGGAQPAAPQATAAGGPPPVRPGAPPPSPPRSPLEDLLSAEVSALPPAAPLGAPLSPVGPGRARGKANYKPLVFGGLGGLGVLAGVVLIYLLVPGAGGGPGRPSASVLPRWATFAVPSQAKGVVYVNVDKLRQSELYRMLQRLVKSASVPVPGMQLGPIFSLADNLTELFVAFGQNTEPIIVFRTREDMSLDVLVSSTIDAFEATLPAPLRGAARPPLQTGAYANVEYLRLPGGGCLAKTAPATFCGTQTEENLKEALGRFQRNESLPLSPDLQEALSHARGDHYFALVDLRQWQPGGFAAPALPASGAGWPAWLGFGATATSGLSIDGTLGFATEPEAQAAKKDLDEMIKKIDEGLGELPPNAPPQMREMLEKSRRIVRAIRASQSGKTVRLTASCSVKDIEDLLSQAKGFAKAFRF